MLRRQLGSSAFSRRAGALEAADPARRGARAVRDLQGGEPPRARRLSAARAPEPAGAALDGGGRATRSGGAGTALARRSGSVIRHDVVRSSRAAGARARRSARRRPGGGRGRRPARPRARPRPAGRAPATRPRRARRPPTCGDLLVALDPEVEVLDQLERVMEDRAQVRGHDLAARRAHLPAEVRVEPVAHAQPLVEPDVRTAHGERTISEPSTTSTSPSGADGPAQPKPGNSPPPP